MNEIYNGMIEFETQLADDTKSNLVAGAEQYKSVLEGMSDEAKDALNTVYTIYAEYLRLIDNLAKDERKSLANLGLTTSGYESIRNAFLGN